MLLENNSVSETDVYFELIVDNLSNPNNAIINIEQNGTIVNVPYGQKVEYAMTLGKSILFILSILILDQVSKTTKSYTSITAEFDFIMQNLEEDINESSGGALGAALFIVQNNAYPLLYTSPSTIIVDEQIKEISFFFVFFMLVYKR